MKRWLLDTSALLALRDDEAGADRVETLLQQAQSGRATCYGCFMSLMELFYRVWKDEGEAAGRLAYAQCGSLPIEWVHESAELLELAAEVKATHALSLADAWIAAAARLAGATLVHKDPEFRAIGLPQEELPLKSG